jgi:hypothetical protein
VVAPPATGDDPVLPVVVPVAVQELPAAPMESTSELMPANDPALKIHPSMRLAAPPVPPPDEAVPDVSTIPQPEPPPPPMARHWIECQPGGNVTVCDVV